MPFKPAMKRGKKRRIVLEFRWKKDRALDQLSKAVKALAKKHKLKLVKRKRG